MLWAAALALLLSACICKYLPAVCHCRSATYRQTAETPFLLFLQNLLAPVPSPPHLWLKLLWTYLIILFLCVSEQQVDLVCFCQENSLRRSKTDWNNNWTISETPHCKIYLQRLPGTQILMWRVLLFCSIKRNRWISHQALLSEGFTVNSLSLKAQRKKLKTAMKTWKSLKCHQWSLQLTELKSYRWKCFQCDSFYWYKMIKVCEKKQNKYQANEAEMREMNQTYRSRSFWGLRTQIKHPNEDCCYPFKVLQAALILSNVSEGHIRRHEDLQDRRRWDCTWIRWCGCSWSLAASRRRIQSGNQTEETKFDIWLFCFLILFCCEAPNK